MPRLIDRYVAARRVLDARVAAHFREIYIPRLSERVSLRRDTETDGFAQYARVCRMMDEFEGIDRTGVQRTFHEHMINASLRLIFDKDFDRCADKICKDNGWSEIAQVPPAHSQWKTLTFFFVGTQHADSLGFSSGCNAGVCSFFFRGGKVYPGFFLLCFVTKKRSMRLSVMFCYGKKKRCASRAEQLSPTLDGQGRFS
jgi:hypothetical protein